MNKKPIIVVCFVIIFVAFFSVLIYGLRNNPAHIPSALIGKKAPDFKVQRIQTKIVTDDPLHLRLKDYLGRPIILNFWGSWCPSCREEARYLEEFWKKHNANVVVVGIAVQDQRPAVELFIKEFGKTYDIGLDDDGKATLDYGVSGAPETFLISKEGIVLYKEAGAVSPQLLERLLKM